MDYPNSIFHKKFQRINGRKENNSFIGNAKIHEYIADSCTTYGRVYLTKNRLFWIRKHYFAKFHETSHNGCYKDNAYKWIKSDN